MISQLSFLVVILSLSYVSAADNTSTCHDIRRHPNLGLLPRGDLCLSEPSQQKVMGGNNAFRGEFPWAVVLFLRVFNSDILERWCTGSIINSKYVITAAHCFRYYFTKQFDLVARVGEHDFTNYKRCNRYRCHPVAVDYEAESGVIYPGYNSSLNINDIGLIRLKKDIIWNVRYVYPVCLPMSCKLMKMDFEHEWLILAGFGSLQDAPKGVSSTVLQKAYIQGASDMICSLSYTRMLLTSQICMGGNVQGEEGRDACLGDSGGPLMYDYSDGRFYSRYLVGLVSSGDACKNGNILRPPGIYTRVASYMKWILDNIRV